MPLQNKGGHQGAQLYLKTLVSYFFFLGHLKEAHKAPCQSGSADTSGQRRMLNNRDGKTTLLWVPGHHGIARNEEADACAKQAAAITDGTPRPVSFVAASALIRRTLTDPLP